MGNEAHRIFTKDIKKLTDQIWDYWDLAKELIDEAEETRTETGVRFCTGRDLATITPQGKTIGDKNAGFLADPSIVHHSINIPRCDTTSRTPISAGTIHTHPSIDGLPEFSPNDIFVSLVTDPALLSCVAAAVPEGVLNEYQLQCHTYDPSLRFGSSTAEDKNAMRSLEVIALRNVHLADSIWELYRQRQSPESYARLRGLYQELAKGQDEFKAEALQCGYLLNEEIRKQPRKPNDSDLFINALLKH
jgi:hypothetical protein